MSDNRCPQCESSLTQPTCRLVQDSCGHKKCRLCLLQEADGCRQCNQENADEGLLTPDHIQIENIKAVDTVIRFENSKNIRPVVNGNGGVEKDSEICDINVEEGEKVAQLRRNGARMKDNEVVKTERKTDVVKKRSYQALVIPSHISVLKDPISYRCNVCNKVFNTKSHVKYHIYCKEGLYCI